MEGDRTPHPSCQDRLACRYTPTCKAGGMRQHFPWETSSSVPANKIDTGETGPSVRFSRGFLKRVSGGKACDSKRARPHHYIAVSLYGSIEISWAREALVKAFLIYASSATPDGKSPSQKSESTRSGYTAVNGATTSNALRLQLAAAAGCSKTRVRHQHLAPELAYGVQSRVQHYLCHD
jgi:hypothetical protein